MLCLCPSSIWGLFAVAIDKRHAMEPGGPAPEAYRRGNRIRPAFRYTKWKNP